MLMSMSMMMRKLIGVLMNVRVYLGKSGRRIRCVKSPKRLPGKYWERTYLETWASGKKVREESPLLGRRPWQRCSAGKIILRL